MKAWAPPAWAGQVAVMQPQVYYRREELVEKEYMFEKPLTPSDVGKLNRLVIPKQHAERYFPIAADSVEKGFLIKFEDESGKAWQFRYSYWTSSQSYVLTKGWSRYVREKRLQAGDVVFFEKIRMLPPADRFCIGYRRHGGNNSCMTSPSSAPTHGAASPLVAAADPWTQSFPRSYNVIAGSQQDLYSLSSADDYEYDDGGVGAGNRSTAAQVLRPATTSSKHLRLFGVNLEYCVLDPDVPSQAEQYSSSSMQAQPDY